MLCCLHELIATLDTRVLISLLSALRNTAFLFDLPPNCVLQPFKTVALQSCLGLPRLSSISFLIAGAPDESHVCVLVGLLQSRVLMRPLYEDI